MIRIAHKYGVPVIVDVAAELPPKKNLTRYFSVGVDLVIYSGGKFIAGPNNSGILVGRKDLIKLAHLQAYPFHGIGRAAKMSRETIVGLITALKKYLELDEASLFENWEKKAIWMVEQLKSIPEVEVGLDYMSTIEEGEPMVPLCYVKIDEKAFGMDGKELSVKLKEGNPRIEAPYEPDYLLEEYKGKLTLNPQYLLEGDEHIVIEQVKKILSDALLKEGL